MWAGKVVGGVDTGTVGDRVETRVAGGPCVVDVVATVGL